MATSWPTELPQTPQYGFQEQRQRNIVSFKPEFGPPKMRLGSTGASTDAVASFIMTDDQVDIFQSFYILDLSDGVLSFQWAHPVTGITYDWVFNSDEAPMIERTAPDVNTVQCKLQRIPG
jgi:hypothetical protein